MSGASTPSSSLAVAVLDANGIIGLAKAQCLEFLPNLFDLILVPPLVVNEITDPLSKAALTLALAHWLQQASPTQASLSQVPPLSSQADRQVLALALDSPASVLITGDLGLTKKAKALQQSTLSAPRIVQALAQLQVIPAAKPALDRMRQAGFGMTQELYDDILQTLGET